MEREERKLKVISGESRLRNQKRTAAGWLRCVCVCFKNKCVFCVVMECD